MSPVTVAVLLIFGALTLSGLVGMLIGRCIRRGQSAETEERPAPWVGRGPEGEARPRFVESRCNHTRALSRPCPECPPGAPGSGVP